MKLSNLNPCEDGAKLEWLAPLVGFPTRGLDCMCCAGARVWIALAVGFFVGVAL